MHNISLEQLLLKPYNVKVSSGRGFVGYADGSICGIKTFGFPPYTANDYRLLFTFIDPVTGKELRDWEERQISDSVRRLELIGGFPDAADPRTLYKGGEWQGGSIERKGSIYWRENGHLISLRITSVLAPLTQDDGFVLSLDFSEVDVPGDEIVFRLEHSDFGFGAVKPWEWIDPESKFVAKRHGTEIEGDGCTACMGVSEGSFDGIIWRIALRQRKQFQVRFYLTVGNTRDEAAEILKQRLPLEDQSISLGRDRWNKQAQQIGDRLPKFRCDLPELEAFYEGGKSTLLSSRWDTPAFFDRPFFCTSNFGYATGAYVWDVSYCPIAMAMWEPAALRKHVLRWLDIDLHKWNQFSPFDGKGMGGWYSLNDFGIVKLIYKYCCATGDATILREALGGVEVIDVIEKLLLHSESHFARNGDLLNYGKNENLLELRSSGYEGYVPSPNGERYYCWTHLAKLKQLIGQPSHECDARAASVKRELFQRLWNDKEKWFDTISAAGLPETVYSVQVFNLLSCGLFEDSILDHFIAHLNEEEFLSKYGLESFSKKDVRYEVSDPDWSGGGSYIGVAPILVTDLFQLDKPEEAWNLLRRILWWPSVFPYYPQIVRSQRQGYAERPICIAGGSTVETILLGIFGLRFELDGSASACVFVPPNVRSMSLRDISISGKSWDIVMENGEVQVSSEAKSFLVPIGKRFQLAF